MLLLLLLLRCPGRGPTLAPAPRALNGRHRAGRSLRRTGGGGRARAHAALGQLGVLVDVVEDAEIPFPSVDDLEDPDEPHRDRFPCVRILLGFRHLDQVRQGLLGPSIL